MTDDEEDTIDDFEGDTEEFTVSDDSLDTDSLLTPDDSEVEAPSGADSMEGLSEGLDPELAAELSALTTDPSGATEHSMASTPDPTVGTSMSAGTPETPEYDTYDIEIDHEKANALLKTVYQKIQQAHNKHYEVEKLVLGLPQFHVLEPWARAEHRQPIEGVLPVSEIVLVPGPMVHPVIPKQAMYTEYLDEREDS